MSEVLSIIEIGLGVVILCFIIYEFMSWRARFESRRYTIEVIEYDFLYYSDCRHFHFIPYRRFPRVKVIAWLPSSDKGDRCRRCTNQNQ
jgi:hypothetical protein